MNQKGIRTDDTQSIMCKKIEVNVDKEESSTDSLKNIEPFFSLAPGRSFRNLGSFDTVDDVVEEIAVEGDKDW